MDDSDNIYYIPNCYINNTSSPNRNTLITPTNNNYAFQQPPQTYSNNFLQPTPFDSPQMMQNNYENNNDYSDLIPPRKFVSSAENNIPGPPPTASSSYNSRPISRRSNNTNIYYYNEDLPNYRDNNDPDYPTYSSYQYPSYYDSSQNQLYMNNMVIPFQKPKVYVREAPILKKSNNNQN